MGRVQRGYSFCNVVAACLLSTLCAVITSGLQLSQAVVLKVLIKKKVNHIVF